jgi:hypothetical protein
MTGKFFPHIKTQQKGRFAATLLLQSLGISPFKVKRLFISG